LKVSSSGSSVESIEGNEGQDKQPELALISNQAEASYRPDNFTADHLGEWCVVLYDCKPYPGKIVEVAENDVKVTCMHRTGKNRYRWPWPQDINWYMDDQVPCIIPAPIETEKRYIVTDEEQWEKWCHV